MIIHFLLAFCGILILLILHELGHFIAAKFFKVKVEEFGIFLPPPIFKKRMGETNFSLNLLPLGAFVKLYGEEEEKKEEGSFSALSFSKKALIVLGGVLSFWILATFLFFILLQIGMLGVIDDDYFAPQAKVIIVGVSPNSPAEFAGLKAEDQILKVQEKEVSKVSEVREIVNSNLGKEISLTIQRGDEILKISLIPREFPPPNEGPMGVNLARIAKIKYSFPKSFFQAPLLTIEKTKTILFSYFEIFKKLIKKEKIEASFSGPVGVFFLLAQYSQRGISYFLNLLAILAIYLAIFNLLPIPGLDGGKLLFLLIEKFQKRPINKEFEQKLTFSFLVFLILISIIITRYDIKKFLGK